ncbi:MAG: aminotransferase class I/II-fold pyridoxal phosphate-dependent enzyme, partial [Candidatus Riflebacteria bacterium]|nr:aminotransferase class I/II-fold pyridoxal phosphate-dependent enzyme [Candidatus Riflebacteria bacterium]
MADHNWYGTWLSRKHRYAACDQPFEEADRFHAIAAGKGLPPIHQVSTFPFHSVHDGAARFLGVSKGGERPYARIYTRMGNPTTEHLERLLFQLECQHIIDKALEADEKVPTIGVLVCSSGMAAISCTLLSLIRGGDEVIAGNVYGCTDSFLRGLEEKFGIKTHWIDVTDLSRVRACLEAHPRVSAVFVESPDNPTLALSDIRSLGQLCEQHHVPLVVDNTFAS